MWLDNLNLSRMIVHFLQPSFRYIQRVCFSQSSSYLVMSVPTPHHAGGRAHTLGS